MGVVSTSLERCRTERLGLPCCGPRGMADADATMGNGPPVWLITEEPAEPAEPVWLIQEDNAGRLRKSPKHLNNLVEDKFQEWKEIGKLVEFVVAYCWGGTRRAQSLLDSTISRSIT